jgi:hypothetical protein
MVAVNDCSEPLFRSASTAVSALARQALVAV